MQQLGCCRAVYFCVWSALYMILHSLIIQFLPLLKCWDSARQVAVVRKPSEIWIQGIKFCECQSEPCTAGFTFWIQKYVCPFAQKVPYLNCIDLRKNGSALNLLLQNDISYSGGLSNSNRCYLNDVGKNLGLWHSPSVADFQFSQGQST